jgi:aspartate aminotransferase
MRQAFKRRRNLLVGLLREIPGLEVALPEGAFYLFPKCSSYFGKTDGTRVIKTSTDLAMYLLEVGHVATVGGDAFGAPDYFRLSYATSEEKIVEGAKRMAKALALLK